MIEPFDPTDGVSPSSVEWYKITALDDRLPAFDPLVMIKTVVIKPSSLSLELIDDVHHYTVITTRGQKLSTKDILVNVIGTMTMLLLRNLFRRYTHAQRQYQEPGTPMQALGYRSKISLTTLDPLPSALSSVLPCPADQQRKQTCSAGRFNMGSFLSARDKGKTFPLLRMYLASESARFDPRKTVWPRVGALALLTTGKRIALFFLGGIAGLFAALQLGFKFWMPVTAIVIFWFVEVFLLVDVLVLGYWGLQDRVFLDLALFGRRAQFCVAPFFLGRIVTIFVWSGRYVNMVLTRHNDSVTILLRGEVEFDYEGWKRQSRLASGVK
ncbi:unnamed protein product [Phytophthora lilii]|uniref:Unnamed protein product n=1 Tax=Phytophthora lilii TaxID=2077276 RepID=A0A9W6U9P1_9STRA|nr:unnamed protein product [Phytophthora lilii]